MHYFLCKSNSENFEVYAEGAEYYLGAWTLYDVSIIRGENEIHLDTAHLHFHDVLLTGEEKPPGFSLPPVDESKYDDDYGDIDGW